MRFAGSGLHRFTKPFLLLSEDRNDFHRLLGNRPVNARRPRLRQKGAKLDRMPKTRDHPFASPIKIGPDLPNEVVAQPVDEHRNHRYLGRVNRPPYPALGGQEGVRVIISFPCSLWVDARAASLLKQRGQLAKSCKVETRTFAVPKYGGIHGKEAHDPIHKESERVIVKKARAHRKQQTLSKTMFVKQHAEYVHVEKAAVIGHQHKAFDTVKRRNAIQAVYVAQVSGAVVNPPGTERPVAQRKKPVEPPIGEAPANKTNVGSLQPAESLCATKAPGPRPLARLRF